MARSIIPSLMFEGRAQEALDFYMSLFPNAAIGEVTRYGPEGPAKEGTIMQGLFTLAGQQFMISDSYIEHPFTFTPSISFFVACEDEGELETLFDALSQDGQVYMPLDDYGFSKRFGWVGDRFGVTWQLDLTRP